MTDEPKDNAEGDTLKADTVTKTKPGIRIVSKGSGHGTRIFLIRNDGTEEDVTAFLKVSRVWWECEARSIAIATLECMAVSMDVVGELIGTISKGNAPLFREVAPGMLVNSGLVDANDTLRKDISTSDIPIPLDATDVVVHGRPPGKTDHVSLPGIWAQVRRNPDGKPVSYRVINEGHIVRLAKIDEETRFGLIINGELIRRFDASQLVRLDPKAPDEK